MQLAKNPEFNNEKILEQKEFLDALKIEEKSFKDTIQTQIEKDEYKLAPNLDSLIIMMDDFIKNGYGERYTQFITNFSKALETLGYLKPEDKMDEYIYPEYLYDEALIQFNKDNFPNRTDPIKMDESILIMSEKLKALRDSSSLDTLSNILN